ncbi:YktB family protein [Macrococcus sp. DPC7161]|uniref:YktB family protein n=1 Tax=Macrococcus sp. DPC7161 TaxID=2507060 RepID=UPI00100AD176|nr:DUF1054 domain-containing protein [Macrococcus sp. DPC7161]RXK18857.1 DUF1054 domain-containing protein [Macrococcus sp. DPC7161]
MNQYHLTQQDFDVFTVEGLEPRMKALIETTRPKLEAMGTYFSEYLTQHTDEQFYPHVAKHLRRKTNPPKDTWVAFATNKRGYKMLPHFQIGLFNSHMFVLYGIIYESELKPVMYKKWKKQLHVIKSLGDDFIIKGDHMNESFDYIKDLSNKAINEKLKRLVDVKKGELLFGKIYTPDHDIFKSDEAFLKEIENVFFKLLPLHQ